MAGNKRCKINANQVIKPKENNTISLKNPSNLFHYLSRLIRQSFE